MCRTVLNSTVQPQQLRKHSKVSVAVTTMLQANVCGPASYGLSILLSPALLPYAYVFPIQFLRFQWSLSSQILSHPFPYPATRLAGFSSLLCMWEGASCLLMPFLHATSSHYTRGKSVPRICLPNGDMKFQSSWGDREADTLLLNSVPPCRSQLLLTRTLSILYQTHEKNK